jgi:hypothetical protein
MREAITRPRRDWSGTVLRGSGGERDLSGMLRDCQADDVAVVVVAESGGVLSLAGVVETWLSLTAGYANAVWLRTRCAFGAPFQFTIR